MQILESLGYVRLIVQLLYVYTTPCKDHNLF